MPEKIKLFGSTKKLVDKAKDRENLPGLEVVDVVLVKFNLVDNKCRQNLRYYILLCPINLMFIS